jgi:FAD/FMN-containing dehydrogenase
MPTTTPAAASLTGLASSIEGRLVLPRDPDYDEMRRVFLGDVDARPAAIARAAGAGDVPKVICFARDSGIELAVRSGGHSNAGQSTTEGGLVLDLRDLTEITSIRMTGRCGPTPGSRRSTL